MLGCQPDWDWYTANKGAAEPSPVIPLAFFSLFFLFEKKKQNKINVQQAQCLKCQVSTAGDSNISLQTKEQKNPSGLCARVLDFYFILPLALNWFSFGRQGSQNSAKNKTKINHLARDREMEHLGSRCWSKPPIWTSRDAEH